MDYNCHWAMMRKKVLRENKMYISFLADLSPRYKLGASVRLLVDSESPESG